MDEGSLDVNAAAVKSVFWKREKFSETSPCPGPGDVQSILGWCRGHSCIGEVRL